MPKKRSQEYGSDEPPGEIFEELLIRHLDNLFAFALRLEGNQAAAEDLVQEASLKGFEAFGSLRETDRFKSWMFQILRNLHFDRKRQGSSAKWVPFEEGEPDPERDGEIPSLQYDQLLLREIKEALDRLPVEFRLVVWLSDVEGFAYQEVSEILGCPVGTVGSRLYRGRALLRRQLAEAGAARKEKK